MGDIVRHSWRELETLATRAFIAAGVPTKVTQTVVAHLMQAEAEGKTGHGLARVHTYLEQVGSGKIQVQAVPKTTWHKSTLLEVDAGHGFAYPAIDLAFDVSRGTAQRQGAVLISISHSHHAGVLGFHVEKFACEGHVALMASNTPAAIAPWGGTKPVLGTNPLAFACPRADREPLVIDFSLSEVARGKVLRAHQEGKSIPDNWATDKHGAPTTDPAAALQGAMLPAGGVKGVMLAMIIELLSAGLGGSHFGFEASSFFTPDGPPPNVAQSLLLITPHDLAGFAARVEMLLAAIEEQEGTRVPGANRIALRENARQGGIEIPAKIYAVLKERGA